MILPGISGSFVLLMLGLYDHVIAALEQRDTSVLGMYAIGALIGLVVQSRFTCFSGLSGPCCISPPRLDGRFVEGVMAMAFRPRGTGKHQTRNTTG